MSGRLVVASSRFRIANCWIVIALTHLEPELNFNGARCEVFHWIWWCGRTLEGDSSLLGGCTDGGLGFGWFMRDGHAFDCIAADTLMLE